MYMHAFLFLVQYSYFVHLQQIGKLGPLSFYCLSYYYPLIQVSNIE